MNNMYFMLDKLDLGQFVSNVGGSQQDIEASPNGGTEWQIILFKACS